MTDWSAPRPCPPGDPYLHWAQHSDFAGFEAAGGGSVDAALPLLIEALGQKADDLALGGCVKVPGIYRSPQADALPHYTGTVRRGDLANVTPAQVRRVVLALPVTAGDIDPEVPPARPGSTEKLVIGVIDRGCAFLNSAVRHAGKPKRTRIGHFWDQGHAAAGQTWRRPAGFGYGRELDAAAIDTLLKRIANGEDEAQLYRELGHLVDPRGRLPQQLHGTHVMDTAAGLVDARPPRGSAKPAKADRAAAAELIFVSVPELAEGDTTGASGDAFVLDAMHYILHRAGSKSRVVINLSIGAQAGPHDGSSCIEQAIDSLLASRKDLAIVAAAGNGRSAGSNRRNGRWQASGRLATDGIACAFVWRTLANDVTDSFLEIWFANEAKKAQALPPDVEVRVTAPDGRASRWTPLGNEVQLSSGAGTAARLACHAAGTSALGRGAMAHLALAPSAGERSATAAGRWLIELRKLSDPVVEFDAWVQRDEPPAGLDEVLQSALEEARHGGDVAIDAGCTLGNLSTAAGLIVVGASRLDDDSAAPYSAGAGSKPSRRASRDIDVMAPADETSLTYGLWAAGMNSGSVFRMSGTSVSAPVLTRVLANWMVRQPAGMSAADIRLKFLQAMRDLPRKAAPRGINAPAVAPRCSVGSVLP